MSSYGAGCTVEGLVKTSKYVGRGGSALGAATRVASGLVGADLVASDLVGANLVASDRGAMILGGGGKLEVTSLRSLRGGGGTLVELFAVLEAVF